jgi:hypothetical protein
VVTHANGVDFLMEARATPTGGLFVGPVAALVARGVRFEVCDITLKNRGLRRDQFLQEANFTPSGVVRLARAAEGRRGLHQALSDAHHEHPAAPRAGPGGPGGFAAPGAGRGPRPAPRNSCRAAASSATAWTARVPRRCSAPGRQNAAYTARQPADYKSGRR